MGSEKRTYTGGSEIGDCGRLVTYKHHPDYEHLNVFTQDTQMLMDIGTAVEPLVRARRGNVTDDQLEVSLGEAKGHIDGLWIDPETGERCLWECKVTTGFNIAKWLKDGLPRRYYWQVMMYMEALSLNRCVLDACDRLNGSITTFVVHYDADVAEEIRGRIELITEARANGDLLPPEFERGSNECRNCAFLSVCHNANCVDFPSKGTSADGSSWDGFRDSIENYRLGEEMEKQGKEMRDIAARELEKSLKRYKVAEATAGGFLVRQNWVEQSRFDQKAFHEQNPDLWSQYQKPTKFPTLVVRQEKK